jgi:hypothetical protein
MEIKQMTNDQTKDAAPYIELGIFGDWSNLPLDPDLQARVEAFEQASEDDRAKDVYAFYGLAMYQAQIVEAELRNLLVAYARVFNDLSPEDVDTYEERFASDTLGRMLSRVKTLATVNDQASNLLRRALQERNRLAHRYFFERIEYLYGFAGQVEVVKELGHLAQLFRHADELFEPLVITLLKKLGAAEEWLSDQLNDMVASAEKKYAG